MSETGATKECRRCKTEKPAADFRPCRGRLRPDCRLCEGEIYKEYCRNNPDKRKATMKSWKTRNWEHYRQYMRDWIRANPARIRDGNLRKLYGISSEHVDRMLKEQGGVCAICGSADPKGKNWNVDHDHVTEIVRGILCTDCNTALGGFKDRPDLLLAALNYLDASAASVILVPVPSTGE